MSSREATPPSSPQQQQQLKQRGSGSNNKKNGPTTPSGRNESETIHATAEESEGTETGTLDKVFTAMFIDKVNKYKDLQEIDKAIDDYEETSGFRLIISKSSVLARTYTCGSHVGCRFRAKFGKIRGIDTMVVKRSARNTHPYHSGTPAPPTAKGRAYKKRLKGRIEQLVENFSTIHDGQLPLRAKDVMEAAADLDSDPPTYNQSYRAIQRNAYIRREREKLTFQMMIPYLKRFSDLNQGSTTKCETDDDNNLTRIFVCPGIMKSTMKFVRPVMSLHAVPLQSQWKGTLYLATVKTAGDEVYPVAISIMNEDEEEEGWNWFLELLHSGLDILVMDHPKAGVAFQYFSFVSNPQKGLAQALQNVFPQNYACIDGTSSSSQLPGSTTDMWLEDMSLPPRYGIVSANNMIEISTAGPWLHILDEVLTNMMQRICTLRDENKGKTGIVQNMADLLTKHWENSARFKVFEIEENGNVYSVIRQGRRALENTTSFTIDVANMTCECGEWQEYCVPCIDAMAYFRLQKKLSLDHVLAHFVDKHYTYENERELLRVNVYPICLDRIVPDKVTLPPKPPTKRVSGPPKKQRIRKRSRWASEPEKSNIVCSRCHKRGHNVRTCIAREMMVEKEDNNSEEI